MVFVNEMAAAGPGTISTPNLSAPGSVGHLATEEETELREGPRRIPIRVLAFDPGRVEFSEETLTHSVSRDGATIGLRHCVVMGDFLRIVNLENLNEADFRIIGPKTLMLSGVSEWVVECTDGKRNIWDLPEDKPGVPDAEEGPLLVCRVCGSARLRLVSAIETQVLESSGMIVQVCERCARPTYWTFNDPRLRPPSYPPFDDPAPPPRVLRDKNFINTRKHPRLALRMPILIRRKDGTEEVSSTENISMGGFAAILALDLEPDERITSICPYMRAGQNIEQEAECRWGLTVGADGSRRIYGFRIIDDDQRKR